MDDYTVEARDGDIVVTFLNNEHIKKMQVKHHENFMRSGFHTPHYKGHIIWGWLGEWATALAMGVDYRAAAEMCLDEDGSKVDLTVDDVKTQVKVSLKEYTHTQYHPNLYPAHYEGTLRHCDAIVWGYCENIHEKSVGYKGAMKDGTPARVIGLEVTDETEPVRVVLRNVALLDDIDTDLIYDKPSGAYTCKWFGDVCVDPASTSIFGGVR